MIVLDSFDEANFAGVRPMANSIGPTCSITQVP